MSFSKYIFTLLLLYLARESVCKPTDNYITEGRGIASNIWDWVTYPFSWWSSSKPTPVSDQLIGSTTLGPYDDIEVERHNVTIWCNDQTCTTMKCDKYGCKNTTCNIYDTDLKGQCRDYVTKPDEPPTKPIDTVSSIKPEVVTNAPQIETDVTNALETSQTADERPLEHQTVSSSTISPTKPTETVSSIKPEVVTNAPQIETDVTNAPETSQTADERPLEHQTVSWSTVTEVTNSPEIEPEININTPKTSQAVEGRSKPEKVKARKAKI